eukprot:GHVO01017112.1.p2 GENE.GHVO01017112.1~~GHVO01017112.1.p2  ORF type:complete len:486 (+),score=71.50 GHVO01017112.1:2297-3754(+)
MKSKQAWHENKWTRLTVYSLACFFNTCIYYGWQQWSMMIFRRGAYEWLCTDEERQEGNMPVCDAQDSKVQFMYTISSSMEYTFGLIAGIILDNVGPRVCAIIGELIWGAGMLILAFCSQDFQGYMPAAVMIGAGVNLVAFPALILEDFFDKYSNLLISLVLSLQVMSSAVAPIMELMVDEDGFYTFQVALFLYLGICWLPLLFVYPLTLPWKRPALILAEAKMEAAASAELAAQSSAEDASDGDGDGEGTATGKGESGIMADGPPPPSKTAEMVEVTPPFSWKSFFKEVWTVEYMLFTVVYVLMILQFVYWPQVILSRWGESFSKYMGWLLPFQGPIGLLLGWAADFTGTLMITIMIALSLALTFAFGFIKAAGPQYFVGFLFNFFQSWIYTTKYTYAAELYPATNFGKLSGSIGFVAGLVGLINIPIRDSEMFEVWFAVWLVLILLGTFVLGYLYHRQYKQKISYKQYQLNSASKAETADSIEV